MRFIARHKGVFERLSLWGFYIYPAFCIWVLVEERSYGVLVASLLVGLAVMWFIGSNHGAPK